MKQQKGFTLIELLVVIAIIGVMAALVIVNLSSANKKSRDARRKADLAEVKTALELYYDDNLRYPAATGNFETVLTSGLTPTYIKTMPADPRNTGTMIYTYTGDSNSYTLNAYLENTSVNYSVFSSN
ncbi:hypothetical protein AUK40_06665 [Candidatus Wirthbacteria bacterium CG2_30_54_11]|uniref:Type II secretion system protein GspG C-terminal domain-containing protein n=1 Tax=Candidatus Wirthbacteria bacterium CG2_30_54_11 TaxID=1817892 RepID=A0A1J5ICA9_9BACT|nr:MAG: hypothetical protein AUK40_06665 [Candidatus Wirthbacteria bacterium CG2_30_54_11]